MIYFFFDNDLLHSTQAKGPYRVVIGIVDMRISVARHFCRFRPESLVMDDGLRQHLDLAFCRPGQFSRNS
jgi:hypothetical protein